MSELRRVSAIMDEMGLHPVEVAGLPDGKDRLLKFLTAEPIDKDEQEPANARRMA